MMFPSSPIITSLTTARPEVMTMKKYFDIAKHFPNRLITQNKPNMQRAYVSVPLDVWAERVLNLQDALQSSRNSNQVRRSIVIMKYTGMTDRVEEVLDSAFLDKYDELMHRVLYDFNDFFPYIITHTSQQVFIFEKMKDMDLISYVIKRL